MDLIKVLFLKKGFEKALSGGIFFYCYKLLEWNLCDFKSIILPVLVYNFTVQVNMFYFLDGFKRFGCIIKGIAETPSICDFKTSLNSVLEIINRKSKIDYTSNLGKKLEIDTIKGKIDIKDGDFYYPARPDIKVLNSLNLKINPGQNIAIVGHSGSGKSTIISILERFYELETGVAEVEDIDVKDWEVTHLRNQMGLVGQEPVLFNRSIKDNIVYGYNKIVSDEELSSI